MLRRVKHRAKHQSLPFDLTLPDIIIPTHCPILNIRLRVSANKLTDNSPSLDRVIPSLGYVRGNVIVISMRANRIKSDASLEELQAITNFYLRRLNAEAAS